MDLIAYLLFALVGFVLGWALASNLAYLALLFPVLLFLIGVVQDGFAASALLELVIAVVIVVAAILAGRALAGRGGSPESQPSEPEQGEQPRPGASKG